MMTVHELSQLQQLKREVEKEQKRLSELEAAATYRKSSITGMPRGACTADRVGLYAADIADLKQAITGNIQRCWKELNRLDQYITSIDNSYIRQIFTLRYIYGLTWQQVAAKLGGGNTEDGVRKAHNRYLRKP